MIRLHKIREFHLEAFCHTEVEEGQKSTSKMY